MRYKHWNAMGGYLVLIVIFMLIAVGLPFLMGIVQFFKALLGF
jgi:hypothetical protein